MRTTNLKKLITGTITAMQYSATSYGFKIDPLSGSFTLVGGDSFPRAYSAAISGVTSEGFSKAVGATVILQAMLTRLAIESDSVSMKSWSSIVTGAKETPIQGLKIYISATYDADDQPISSADYAMRGTNVSATISVQNNGTVTVTFSNAGSEVLHANRIGITGVICPLDASSNAKCALLHIFAFDDIALAPGETKSITIQPDLD